MLDTSDTRTATELLAGYFRQQKELGMPDVVLSEKIPLTLRDELPRMPRPVARADIPVEAEGVGDTYQEKRTALAQLYYSAQRCQNCGLANIRKNMVFGAGNAAAEVMVIGEAPGQEEDKEGLPFVGAAGKLLTQMLDAIGLDRQKHVFITNVLKCRPPGNRDPETGEVLACAPILSRQVAIVAPKAILVLGRIAAHELLDTTDPLGKLRTQNLSYRDIPVIVTYHPAALLRNPQYKRPAWEDLQKLQAMLKAL